jgi:hypothetical protein
MQLRGLRVVALLLFAALVPQPTASAGLWLPSYEVLPLPLPLAAESATPVAMNPQGVIVGWARFLDGSALPVRWERPYVTVTELFPRSWHSQQGLLAMPAAVGVQGEVYGWFGGLTPPPAGGVRQNLTRGSHAWVVRVDGRLRLLPSGFSAPQFFQSIQGRLLFGSAKGPRGRYQPAIYDWKHPHMRLPLRGCVESAGSFLGANGRGVVGAGVYDARGGQALLWLRSRLWVVHSHSDFARFYGPPAAVTAVARNRLMAETSLSWRIFLNNVHRVWYLGIAHDVAGINQDGVVVANSSYPWTLNKPLISRGGDEFTNLNQLIDGRDYEPIDRIAGIDDRGVVAATSVAEGSPVVVIPLQKDPTLRVGSASAAARITPFHCPPGLMPD